MEQDLNAQIAELTKRLADLETQVAQLRQLTPDIDDETLMVISAAVSAFMGHKAKVRQVHFASRGSWTAEGRQAVHRRSVPHVR